MTQVQQLELFEPTGSEVVRLAFEHERLADRAWRHAELAATRGWRAVELQQRELCSRHEVEAAELAMLAEFERLGGVRS